VNTLLVHFKAVVEALENITDQSTGQASTDAVSYGTHVTSFPFIVAAVVSQYLLGFVRSLSVALLYCWSSKLMTCLTSYTGKQLTLRQMLMCCH